ncbi:hypothetical protein EHS13_25200 [Paenibacillus psychroresistens]|uniref:Phage tail collar domain-containing protein n=1 Tax=Paenibacillus psychroresistens TaxID=1778678 RepID=A0A6B8RNM2_9BACL|nr:InlB B-repeat-containing protein [Paenibacillus psychroresistens]QGQ97951.1 hypothetical protein EHS13_25200 [Paenibacillus psychroresistens]
MSLSITKFKIKPFIAIILTLALLFGGLTLPKQVHAGASYPYVGEIKLFPYGRVPDNWVYCAGQTLSVSTYASLFSLVGDRFGGNGTTTFAVPDLRGTEPNGGVGYYIALAGDIPSSSSPSGNAILGEARLFPYNFTPENWVPANGQALNISQNAVLFILFGNTFGGDPQSDFNLPLLDPIKTGVNYYIATAGVYPNNGTGSEFVGEILMLPYSYAQGNLVNFAEGQVLPINPNAAIFSLFGIKFGGNGSSNFGLPNLSASNPARYSNTSIYPKMYRIMLAGVYPSMTNNISLPYPSDDNYTLSTNSIMNVVSSLGVLANDSGGANLAILQSAPSHGSLILNTDGSFSYTPEVGYVGQDSFTYRAYNNEGYVITTVILTRPVSTFTGVTAGGVYNYDRTINFAYGTALLDNVSFSSGNSVITEGFHTIIFTPFFGLTSTIYFTIDKTNPIISGVTEGEVATTVKTITFNEGTATLDGVVFVSGSTVNVQGAHALTVTDAAGNSVTRHFTIAIPPSTVVFDSNGGTAVTSQSVGYNGTASAPTVPTKTGYTFGGWYSDIGTTQLNNFGAPITGSKTLYAKWTINTFTVSFNSDGGTPVTSQSVDYNSTATEPITPPTKTGYTFGGWYSDSGTTQLNNFEALITGSKTLYAKWTINTYTVSFNSDGGSPVTSQSVNYNGTASVPTVPTKTGYSFGGWFTDIGTTQLNNFGAQISDSKTLYAKWTINTYTVSFNSDGGTPVTSQSVDYNSTATEPITPPTKTGYSFGGWYSDSGTTQLNNFGALIIGSKTLYAKWTINTYTVSFNSDGGSPVTSQSVNYNGTASVPTVPTKTGYSFGGWFTDIGTTQLNNFGAQISDSKTLYAKWTINTYTVSFNSDGGTPVTSQSVDYNSTATEPITPPTKTGYSFGGWYSDSGTTQLNNFGALIIGSKTLYAKWTINTYTISFKSDGGSPVTSQSVDYNLTATEPITPPIKTGYTFEGWFTDSGTTQFNNFGAPITGNTTIYAKWTIKTYLISYNSNGGTPVTSQSVDYNLTATEPVTPPTKTGYTFGGWFTDIGTTQPNNFGTLITDSKTLFAKWTINKYTISFNSNGGSPVTSESVDYNLTATEPITPPTKTGYTFEGWFTDSGTTQPNNFESPITNDVTLNAKWTINKYTVIFNSNGGSAANEQNVEYNSKVSVPGEIIKTGYSFVGWYADINLVVPYDFVQTTITGITTLYAKWGSPSQAEVAVSVAELEQTQISVNAAIALAVNLNNGLKKDSLLARLQVLQVLINNTHFDIADLVLLWKVGTDQQKDINQDNAVDNKDIQILLQRISTIEH